LADAKRNKIRSRLGRPGACGATGELGAGRPGRERKATAPPATLLESLVGLGDSGESAVAGSIGRAAMPRVRRIAP
jgi:hypothetical protein